VHSELKGRNWRDKERERKRERERKKVVSNYGHRGIK
jgi:hypothetical protein